MKFSSLIIGFTICVLSLASFNGVFAYSSTDSDQGISSPSLINPLDIFKSDFFKNAAQQLNVGTTTPTSTNINLFDLKDLSSGDFVSVLKAIGTLAINLFIIVIQVVVAILKGLLPFLSR
jgi:hypothetical protein